MIFDGFRESWEERPKRRSWRWRLLRAAEWFIEMVGRTLCL